ERAFLRDAAPVRVLPGPGLRRATRVSWKADLRRAACRQLRSRCGSIRRFARGKMRPDFPGPNRGRTADRERCSHHATSAESLPVISQSHPALGSYVSGERWTHAEDRGLPPGTHTTSAL